MTWSCRKPLPCVSECVWKLQKSIIQLDIVVADVVVIMMSKCGIRMLTTHSGYNGYSGIFMYVCSYISSNHAFSKFPNTIQYWKDDIKGGKMMSVTWYRHTHTSINAKYVTKTEKLDSPLFPRSIILEYLFMRIIASKQ